MRTKEVIHRWPYRIADARGNEHEANDSGDEHTEHLGE